MRLAEAWRVAVTALRANRLRSALTMVGVVIGVAAVVVITAIGTGATREVEAQVEGLGSNLVIIVPGQLELGSAPTKSRLELGDAERVGRAIGQPDGVAVSVASGETVRAGGREAFATVNGTNPAVPEVFVRPLARGSYLRASDVDTRRRVAVLGSRLARDLFPGTDPLGRQITVGGVRFRVIGVFASAGSGALGGGRDSEVHVPVTAAQRLFGETRVDALALKADSPDDIEQTRRTALAVLADRYPEEEFSAVTQDEILGTVGRILGLLTVVLAAIAGISLLVGGVGVSNIMLVSVRERTREIGLRKAVGARQKDVLLQFLLEAVLLTSIGGVTGIVLGIGAALGMSALVDQLPAVITWWSPLIAFSVSAAVGLFFGVVPARRAGRLDPVTALRTE
ncbi:MAG: permease [Frankiales bacterium]|nr:permease [Frankiales bacterium]